MSFPHNSLPSEFEQDHGSTDLADFDKKPDLYAGEDEDLGIEDIGQRIWLVKIPKFLMEKWSNVEEEGKILGRVRVYDEKDVNGDPKIAVILEPSSTDPNPILIPIPIPMPGDSPSADSPPSSSSTSGPTSSLKSKFSSNIMAPKQDLKGKGRLNNNSSQNVPGRGGLVPTEYKLTLQNTDSKNMFIFGEKEEEVKESGEEGHRKRRRITQILGTVHHECALTPSISSAAGSSSYQTIMRDRLKKASEPRRTIKQLDVDAGTANQLASGARLGNFKSQNSLFVKPKVSAASNPDLRTARIPRNELLDALFKLFESHPYWQLKALTEHVKQPQSYLKEVLSEIAQLLPRGPYVGMWTLKDQFKGEGMGMAIHHKKEEEVDEGAAPKKEEDTGGNRMRAVDALDEGDEEDDDMEEVEIIES